MPNAPVAEGLREFRKAMGQIPCGRVNSKAKLMAPEITVLQFAGDQKGIWGK